MPDFVPEPTKNLLAKAHELVADVVFSGDRVVDATLGNGHDTLFLTHCVGEGGHVSGFDIQSQALKSTQARLLAAGVNNSLYDLHLQSHARMADVVDPGVAAVVFNLGYLPGADPSVITLVRETLNALDQSISLLRPGGVLSVMCYPGHAGGDVEAKAVRCWMAELHGKKAEVREFHREHHEASSPFLLVAERWAVNG